MKAISIKLPDELFDGLATYAEQSHTTASALVREALASYLATSAHVHPASAAARMRQWCGVLEAPSDLSTNPVHLQRFGQ